MLQLGSLLRQSGGDEVGTARTQESRSRSHEGPAGGFVQWHGEVPTQPPPRGLRSFGKAAKKPNIGGQIAAAVVGMGVAYALLLPLEAAFGLGDRQSRDELVGAVGPVCAAERSGAPCAIDFASS